jgi:hypothetical protein
MRHIFIFCFAALLLIACNGRTRRNGTTVNVSPENTSAAQQSEIKPAVNIYIENSGSMDGYVKGVTEFEQAVYRYLSNIKNENITDSFNLFYINSEILKQPDDVDDFINKLEPSSFKAKGGNRKTSDISNVIKSTLAETGEHDIAILVTDGIFSPGKTDATNYLVNQEIGITNTMSGYLKKCPNTAVIAYQLFSNFDGIYYNNIDKHIQLNEQRPYYIYIFGQAKNLTKLRNKIPESSFEGGGIKKMFFISAENQTIDYSVIRGSGQFDIPHNSKTDITNWKKDRQGNFKFAVAANFENLLLDEEYLTNPDNYELQNDYELTIKKSKNSEKYTLNLHPSNNKPHKGVVSLKLKMATPDWDDVNDDDGSKAVAGKTFGIKYQIQGIFNAYAHTGKQTYYTEIKINIGASKYGTGFMTGLIILLITAVVAFVCWLAVKNKQ